MAMEDGIAGGLVAITRATICDLIGESGARSNALAVEIIGIRVVPVVLPLMGVQVEDVMFLGPGVLLKELNVIVDRRLMHV